MDIALYLIAAAILIVLLVFAVKVRRKTEEADVEQRRDVVRAAGPPQRAAEDRGAGMPRRRRNLATAMANRRPQREAPVEPVYDSETELGRNCTLCCLFLFCFLFQAEMEEREERKRMQELREQERRQEEEKERLLEQRQEEEERRAKEEQERRDEEEYLKLKASFVIEDQGEEEQLSEDQSRSLLQEFIQYIECSKVVLLEDLASHFGMRTQDAIARLQDLLAEGSLTGVIDDRGKFISITPEELDSVAQFIRQRGRVSITELAQASNSLINLTPESRSAA
uniref:DDRGK domain-containing protein 1 n=1 Tax=Stegastes partitus TaxID=144197 RepID=A0A3B5AM22_9TELE